MQSYNTESSKYYRWAHGKRMVQALKRMEAKLNPETENLKAEENPLRPAIEDAKKEAHEE